MAKKKTSRRRTKDFKCKMKEGIHGNETGSAFYFLGFIGALVYYITTAPSFWDGVIGFLKALIWPAVLVHGALVALGL